MNQPQTEQEALYEDIPRIAAQIHRVALILSDYPREIGELVIKAALKKSALKDNRRRKLGNLIGAETDALRDLRRNAAGAATTAQPERPQHDQAARNHASRPDAACHRI